MKIRICDKCSKVLGRYDHTCDVTIETKPFILCIDCHNELFNWFDQRPVAQVVREEVDLNGKDGSTNPRNQEE